MPHQVTVLVQVLTHNRGMARRMTPAQARAAGGSLQLEQEAMALLGDILDAVDDFLTIAEPALTRDIVCRIQVSAASHGCR
jgi:hypothetical protein